MTRRYGAFPGLPSPVKGVLGLLAVMALAGLLSGCAGTGGSSGDVELTDIEDAVPKVEPKSKYGNPKSYVVFGKRYHTKDSADGHVERGVASWYGPKFHGRRTSSGERYDMHAMTAAHKSLPLPTYARVTNLENGRTAVVRINDRGPFHGNRVIDLSYAAATKLGVVKKGTARVEVRAIDPRRPDSAPASDNLFADAGPPTNTKSEPARRESKAIVAAAPKPAIQVAAASSSAAPEPASQPKARHEPRLASAETTPKAANAAAMYLQVGAFGNRSNAEQLHRQLVSNLAENVSVRTADGGKAPLYKVHIGPLDSRSEAKDVSQKLASLGLEDAHVVME